MINGKELPIIPMFHDGMAEVLSSKKIDPIHQDVYNPPTMFFKLCFKTEEHEEEIRETFLTYRIIQIILFCFILFFGILIYYLLDCYATSNSKCVPQIVMISFIGTFVVCMGILVIRWIWCMPVKKAPILPIVEPKSVIENPMHPSSPVLDRRGSVPSMEFSPEHSRSRSGSKESSSPKSPKHSKESKRSSRELSLTPAGDLESFTIKNPMESTSPKSPKHSKESKRSFREPSLTLAGALESFTIKNPMESTS